MEKWDVDEMAGIIRELRRNAEVLKEKGEGIEAVQRTVERILAGIKLLEINISDVKTLLEENTD
jgi:hypothetical protein